METAATALLAGAGLIVVTHWLEGGWPQVALWANYALTGRGPGVDHSGSLRTGAAAPPPGPKEKPVPAGAVVVRGGRS